MSAAEGFFVQYSVVAVFGSVLGCVMLPLITQSYETLIFSMVLIGLTAPRFYRKAKSNNDQHGHVKDVERGTRKSPETSHGTKKKKKMPQLIDAEEVRRRREEELRRTEEDRKLELEKREEGKKEKKARKKLERMKRKEQEKLEKEREEEERHRRSFERAQRRLANTTADLELFEKSCVDNLTATVKRASSTSSISSSCSNGSSSHSPNSVVNNAFPRSRSSGNSARSPTATPWHPPKPVMRPYSVSYNDSGPTITECSKPMKRLFVRGSSAPQVMNSSSCWQSKQPKGASQSKKEIDINQDTHRCEAVPVYMSPYSTEDLLSMPIQSQFTNSVPLRPESLSEFNYQAATVLGHASAPNWRLYSLFGQGNVAPPAFGPVVQPCSGPANHMPHHIW